MLSESAIFTITTVAGLASAVLFVYYRKKMSRIKADMRETKALKSDKSRLQWAAMKLNDFGTLINPEKLTPEQSFDLVVSQLQHKLKAKKLHAAVSMAFLIVAGAGIIVEQWLKNDRNNNNPGTADLTIYVYSGNDSLQTPADLVGKGQLVVNLYDNTNPFMISKTGTHIGKITSEKMNTFVPVSIISDEYEPVNPQKKYLMDGRQVYFPVKKKVGYTVQARTLYVSGEFSDVIKTDIARRLKMTLADAGQAINVLSFKFPEEGLHTDEDGFSSYDNNRLVGVFLNEKFLFDLKREPLGSVSYGPKKDVTREVKKNVASIVARNQSELFTGLQRISKREK